MMGSRTRGSNRSLWWTPSLAVSITLVIMVTTGSESLAALQTDQIEVPGAATADKVVVRVYGQRKGESSDCENASFLLQSGAVNVGEMVSSECTSEATVFSARHAPLTAVTAWSDGADTFSLDMGGSLREVELDVYIVATARDAATWASHDVLRANMLYAKNRVGLTFTSTFRSPNSLSDADVATIGTGCDHADEIKNSSSVYNANRINVYIVPSIDVPLEPNRSPRGFDCYLNQPGNTDGAANIIYISIAEHSQNTLAHELGHALGLQGITEHTGEFENEIVDGFENHNLMWNRLNSNTVRAQNQFSLGQAFRMNADERSWLNRSGGVASAFKARDCHPTRADDKIKRAKDEEPCPPLAFDVPANVP